MAERPGLVPRVAFTSGLGLVLVTLIGNLVYAADPEPRCLAGLFASAFVPGLAGFLVLSAGMSASLSRRRVVGCVAMLVFVALSAVAAMGLVSSVEGYKLSRELDDITGRCAPLRASLAVRRSPLGAYPSDIGQLPPGEVAACALPSSRVLGGMDPGELAATVAQDLTYRAGGGAYLLTLPGSSLDLEGSTFFCGPDTDWANIPTERRLSLERQARAGATGPLEDPDEAYYDALFRRVSGLSPRVALPESRDAGLGLGDLAPMLDQGGWGHD